MNKLSISTKVSETKYIPFARKYRPNDFSQLQGQEVLVTTLNHCIEQERIAQAYLLTGIRGVGKTSTARIIAKTLNCENKQKNKSSSENVNNNDIIVPCEECKNCQAVKNVSHPDIIEIDAASHTGVDDVRNVIDSSEYMPLLGKYKLFIIDEVHMLSRSAFNALLKIVEEPPAHVVFIFATTEVQKIPLTIISRCQRFDLRRFSFNEIYALLANIAKQEKINISEKALSIIAVKSEGSARDAIAILDQAASFVLNSLTLNKSGEKLNDISKKKIDVDNQIAVNVITEDVINDMLGLVQHSWLLRLVQYIVANDAKSALDLLQKIYNTSSSLENYIASVADFIAEMTKEKMIQGYHNPLYASFANEITDLIIGLSVSRLSTLWQIFTNGVNEIKHSHNELLSAEMTIIKAINASNMPSIEQLLTADKQLNNFLPTNDIASSPSLSLLSNEKQPTDIIQPCDNDVVDLNDQANIDSKNNIDKKANVDTNIDIFEFLKYCHSHNEMDVYYCLLNNVEVKSFTKTQLELAGKITAVISDKIKQLLDDWSKGWPEDWQKECSGQKYKIIKSKAQKEKTLKEEMIDQARLSEDFNMIKNKFPEANISDIIMTSK